MFNFNELVTNLLLESITPEWYKDVVNHFKDVTDSTVITDIIPPSGDLLKTLQIAIKGDVGNVSPRQISINYLSIFDLFVAIVETSWGSSFKKGDNKTIENFFTTCPGYNDTEIGQIINNWTNTDLLLWTDYTPMTRNGSEVQRKAQGEADVLGAVALQTLSNQTVLGATQTIVKKRINALEAVSSLRFGNFQNLVRDIFNRLPGYVSGSIKITKDFDKLVDDLYVADIYSVAALSMTFYDSEVAKLATEPQTSTAPQTQNEQPSLPGFESRLVKQDNKHLIKEEGTAAGVAAALAAAGLTTAIINYIKKRPYDPGYMNFVEKGIIDTKTKDNVPVKGKMTYTVETIQKIQTKEARELIQKLQNISAYTKKKTSPGQVVGGVARALGSLTSGIGPVN
jgi:hypothetical protein